MLAYQLVGESIWLSNCHHHSVASVISLLDDITDVAELIQHHLLAVTGHEVLSVISKEAVNQSITLRNSCSTRYKVLAFEPGLVCDISY
ncbi:MAG: hypothetical protein CK429_25125 [Mycobacterium sp.]|nr:MAG: hypothetical protein CK429_25125 [Mycobacterium sp.]